MKKFTSVRVVEGFRDRKPSGSGVSNTIARQMGGFSGAGWYVVNEIGEDSGYAVTKVHDGPFTTFSDAAKSPSYSDTTQVVHLNKQGGLSEGFRDRTVITKPKTSHKPDSHLASPNRLKGKSGWVFDTVFRKKLGKNIDFIEYAALEDSIDFRVCVSKQGKAEYDVDVHTNVKGYTDVHSHKGFDTLFKAVTWAQNVMSNYRVDLPFPDDDVADLLVPWSDVP